MHASRRFHLYHLQFQHGDDYWTNLAGTSLKLPLSLENADTHCQVFRSTEVLDGKGMIYIISPGFATDALSQPHIVYAHGKGRFGQGDRTWVLAIGDAESGLWRQRVIPHGGQLTIEEDQSLHIYSNQVNRSIDGGETWQVQADFRELSLGGHSLVYVGAPEARMVAHDTSGDEINRRIYLWSDDGFVTARQRSNRIKKDEPIPNAKKSESEPARPILKVR